MDFGIIVPQGWRLDLVGISDPTEAYETMTRVAQEADALGYHSIWLYDHFVSSHLHRCIGFLSLPGERPTIG